MQLREAVDPQGLKYLLNHPAEFELPGQWTAYVKEVLAGVNQRIVTYKKCKHGKGRVYADKGLSLQAFSKEMRRHLCGQLYHDIDIVNCHPTLLLHICREHKWDVPILAEYVAHREETLNKLQATKLDVLSVLYGSAVTNEKLKPFKAEMSRISKLIHAKYTDIPVPKRAQQPAYTRMSLVLQEYEHNLLMEMAEFFRGQAYEIGVYIFDGMLIYKKDGEQELDESLLRRCEGFLSVQVRLTAK